MCSYRGGGGVNREKEIVRFEKNIDNYGRPFIELDMGLDNIINRFRADFVRVCVCV